MAMWCKTRIPGKNALCLVMPVPPANIRAWSEMIFDVANTIAFLSQGTTLEKGTAIMTGTGPGIGAMRSPKVVLRDGDDMRVEVEKIGTLINKVYYE